MKIHGYNKPIVTFITRSYRDHNGQRIQEYEERENAWLGDVNKDDIVELTNQERKLDKKYFGTIEAPATLYFDKSATFPRYKLEGTEFKRCIKKDKADAIIVGEQIAAKCSYRTRLLVIETTDKLYVAYNFIDVNDTLRIMRSKGINGTVIWNDRCYVYPPKSQILFDTPTVPLIYDKDLSKMIDKTTDQKITEDDAIQIINMLNAPDRETKDLGLKLLASFSYTLTPHTIRTILACTKDWRGLNSATSVAVTSMLDSVGFKKYWDGYHGLVTRLNFIKDMPTEPEDFALSQKILQPLAENYIKAICKTEIKTFGDLGVKITINAEL